jgi:hypothetical protein
MTNTKPARIIEKEDDNDRLHELYTGHIYHSYRPVGAKK